MNNNAFIRIKMIFSHFVDISIVSVELINIQQTIDILDLSIAGSVKL